MRIEYGCWANCSESVFRFITLDPKQIQFILQAIADEVHNAYPDGKEIEIPLFKTAEEYNTGYKKATSKEWDEHFKTTAKIRKDEEKGKITREQSEKLYNEEVNRFNKMQYPKGALISACAGLGDNEAIVTIEKKKKAFRLNIGNNDISDNKTDWIGKVISLGIKVQEAEFSKELQKWSRDCTCGQTFFQDYENLIKDKETKGKEVEQNI